jgi:hypothetical protein
MTTSHEYIPINQNILYDDVRHPMPIFRVIKKVPAEEKRLVNHTSPKNI